jgi:Tol biopolymer transport system component
MRRLAAIGLLAAAVAGAGCGGPYHTFVPFATVDADPAWSPDGHLIAFASSRRGGGIYVLRPDGTVLRRLVAGATTDVAWSPDGGRLAYVGADGLYVVGRDGGPPRRIARDRLREPAWAPHGERLAVVREERDLTTAIYVMNADGTGLRRLLSPYAGSEAEPSWSPDGRELAVEAGNGQLVAVRVADGAVRKIAGVQAFQPAWSPDGRWIAFQSGEALWVARADGSGGLRTVAEDKGIFAEGGSPSWSPDSRQLVFEVLLDRGRYARRASTLSIVDLAGGEPRRLTYGASSWDDPAWRDGIVGKSTW